MWVEEKGCYRLNLSTGDAIVHLDGNNRRWYGWLNGCTVGDGFDTLEAAIQAVTLEVGRRLVADLEIVRRLATVQPHDRKGEP